LILPFASFFISQVPAPVAVQTEEAKNKSERFGVFCQTYDLEAVNASTLYNICAYAYV
jgi:hypothetical protein